MSFWELPEELLDDPDALVNWLHASVDAAYRAKAGKSKKPSVSKTSWMHHQTC